MLLGSRDNGGAAGLVRYLGMSQPPEPPKDSKRSSGGLPRLRTPIGRNSHTGCGCPSANASFRSGDSAWSSGV